MNRYFYIFWVLFRGSVSLEPFFKVKTASTVEHSVNSGAWLEGKFFTFPGRQVEDTLPSFRKGSSHNDHFSGANW